jgi:hypothetical protein
MNYKGNRKRGEGLWERRGDERREERREEIPPTKS